MNDLIKQIQGQYNLSKIHIINQIDSSNFEKEKTVFLNIFQDILSISL